MNSERTRLVGDTDDEAVSQADLRTARFAWIHAMNILLDLLDYTTIDTDTRRRLLADLRDAQARALKPTPKNVDESTPEAEDAPQ